MVFSNPFSNLSSERKRNCIHQINTIKKSYFLENPEDKIKDYFYQEFSLEEVSVGEEELEQPYEDSLRLNIPITGEESLFELAPSTHRLLMSYRPPNVFDNKIIYEIQVDSSRTPEQIDSECKHIIDYVKHNTEQLNKDIRIFNSQLKQLIEDRVKRRIEDIKKKEDIISKLNIKLKKRDNVPETYSIPIRKKKIILSDPKTTSKKSSDPEPTLNEETYEEILSIMDNMSKVMEYSPSVFNKIEEEDLRTHFLVQLNGRYEGKATGETFNLEGKTDICIKENGANIFVAECKYWHGEKEFIDAINQLLGYVSWRDTKTSIVLFNTNKNFSKVLSQIPEIVKKHENFKSREEKYGDETSFRFVMKNKNDEEKEFLMTIKCYNIPQK